MALITEDGSGKNDAESYISVAAADTYHINHGGTSWAGTAEANKEIALRQATQYLDTTFKTRWKGRSVTKAQALDWPRAGVRLDDGWYIDNNEMPSALLRATAELALSALTETLQPSQAEPGTITFTSIRVGPIEEKAAYSSRSQIKYYRLAHELIRDLVVPVGQVSIGQS